MPRSALVRSSDWQAAPHHTIASFTLSTISYVQMGSLKLCCYVSKRRVFLGALGNKAFGCVCVAVFVCSEAWLCVCLNVVVIVVDMVNYQRFGHCMSVHLKPHSYLLMK